MAVSASSAVLLRAVVDALTDGVAVIDGELRVQMANRTFARLCGGLESDHLGRPLGAVVSFAAADRLARILSQAGAEAQTLERVPVEVYLAAGRRSFILSARPLVLGEAGGPHLLIGLRDNNWAHAAGAADTVDHANKQVVEINHRVKNNLASILAMMRLEGRDVDDHAARAVLTRIALRVRAVAALYDLLALERRPGRIDLLTYLTALARSVEQMAGNGRSRWTIAVTGEALDVGIDDAVRLGAVINELVMNAVKYAFDGVGENGRVLINCQRDGEEVVVTVNDNGAGMTGESANGLSTRSSGLGTRLVDLYLGALEGSMERTTACGRGTVCVVRAPYRPPGPPRPLARAHNNLAQYKRIAESRAIRSV